MHASRALTFLFSIPGVAFRAVSSTVTRHRSTSLLPPLRLVPDVQWCWAAVNVLLLALLSKQVVGDILKSR